MNHLRTHYQVGKRCKLFKMCKFIFTIGGHIITNFGRGRNFHNWWTFHNLFLKGGKGFQLSFIISWLDDSYDNSRDYLIKV